MINLTLCYFCQAQEKGEFETLKNCELVEDKFSNDGDSFKVKVNGKIIVVRLYGVDCMETNAKADYMQARLREQALYFGIQNKAGDNFKNSLKVGDQAKVFTEKLLKKGSFTIKTKYFNTKGKNDRIFAYVTISDGRDLGELLVKAGLARVYGLVDDLPDVKAPFEYQSILRIHEIQAIRKGTGAWKMTDWGNFESVRAEYRKLIHQKK